MIDDYAELREMLTKRRTELGYTLKEVADRMGYCQSYLSGLERGYPRDPAPRTFRRWAQALHCDLNFDATLSFQKTSARPILFDVTPTVNGSAE